MSSVRVLYVEDDPSYRTLVASYFEDRDDMTVTCVADAAAGLNYLKDGDIDCIVSDYEMPGLDGIAFLERVRERDPSLPFLLHTGLDPEAIGAEAFEAGVSGYVPKGGPETLARLEARIRATVSEYGVASGRDACQTIIESLEDPVYVLDEAGQFVDVNDAFLELTGHERETVIGSGVSLIKAPGEIARAERRLGRMLSADGPDDTVIEVGIRTADGRTIVCEDRLGILPMKDGRFAGVAGVLREKPVDERSPARSVDRFEALFEHSPDMIDVHDAEGTILDVNPRLCTELGYEPRELIGRKVWELDDAIDPDTATKLWTRMEAGERRRLEGRYRRSDGSLLPVEVHVVRTEIDGNDRFLAISRDISARRAYERELERENERLEEFATIVSHDLRNPLSVAQGRLDLARAETDGEHLAAAADALDRMEILIDDLLTLAREGAAATETEPVDLGAVAAESWRTVETGGATLGVETDATVLADEPRLRQLFENLFRNAVEHGGPEVTVTVGDVAGDAPDERSFYVADDGPGIPPDDRERVFEAGHSTADDGTGFGLSIVREIAQAHGWKVRASEGDNDGARFEITGVETPD